MSPTHDDTCDDAVRTRLKGARADPLLRRFGLPKRAHGAQERKSDYRESHGLPFLELRTRLQTEFQEPILRNMQSPDCPVCSSPASFERRSADADLYRCGKCDHCFSILCAGVERYSNDYYQKNWFQNANTELFARIGQVISQTSGAGVHASVLDIGCGNGAFLRFLRDRYPFELSGVDIRENPPCDGIRFYQSDVSEFSPGCAFDCVVALALIEHLQDVRSFVRKIRCLCAPGGLVILMTCNDRSLLYAAARSLAKIGITGPHDQLYSRHHVNHFNERSLRALLELNGLALHSLLRHNIPVSAIDMAGNPSGLRKVIFASGAWGCFTLGKAARKTYLQTAICRNPQRPLSTPSSEP